MLFLNRKIWFTESESEKFINNNILLEINQYTTNNKCTNTKTQISKHTKTQIYQYKTTQNTNAEWACRLMMEAPAWRPNARGQDTTARNEFQI